MESNKETSSFPSFEQMPMDPLNIPDVDTCLHVVEHDENGPIDISESCFSDEPQSDEENSHPQNDNNTEHKNIQKEILKLADQNDAMKTSRTTLMFRITSQGAEMPIISEEPGSCSELSTEKSSLREELPLSEISTPKNNQETPITDPQEGTPSQTSIEQDSPKQEEIKQKKQSTITFKTAMKNPLQNFMMKKEEIELPTVAGYLKKKSPGFIHVWQTRYVVLKDKKVLYYKSDAMDRPLGCLDFDLFSAKLEINPKEPKRFMIVPVGSNRTFTFKADNDEEGKKWTEALNLHIQSSNGSKCVMSSIVAKRNFWKHDRISESKFKAESKTGDILLFRTSSMAAKLQRSVTRSEYDHVALILKYDSGDVVLFEANGNDGVGLCRWTTFKRNNWHILYEKVVYRKLYVERTNELIEKAEKFVKTAVGKKYAINAKKLMQRKSTSIGIETPEDRTFFCSELVAACYKRMGLLPDQISSSSYLPGNFSAEKKLPLLGGAKFGDEALIDFNL